MEEDFSIEQEIDEHAEHSVLREKIVEHVFVGEALRFLWARGIYDVEVLKSEFDAHGYDIAMSVCGKLRFIQFKTGLGERPKPVTVSKSLENKVGGCVVWISIDRSLTLRHFWYFGASHSETIPALETFAAAKTTKRNIDGERSERKNHKKVPPSVFRKFGTIDLLISSMFELDLSDRGSDNS